jgi:hypothetical protein
VLSSVGGGHAGNLSKWLIIVKTLLDFMYGDWFPQVSSSQ